MWVGAPPGESEWQGDVLLGRQGGDQVVGLEHEAHAVAAEAGEPLVVLGRQIGVTNEDRPRGERIEPGEAVEQGRLARP